jgi:hypothetical protein
MELSNYELIRYPSGQLVITRVAMSASGVPLSGPRDVIGAYTSEQEAQSALHRLANTGPQRTADTPSSSTAQRA